MPRFQLEKWYLDLTTERGETRIGYAATLRYGLELDYAALLCAPPAHFRSSLRRAVPRWDGQRAEWDAPGLGVSGRWTARVRGPEVVVAQSPEGGTATWRCLAPSCEVELVEGSQTLRGLGYLERLDLEVPPWRLPMEFLRWGRFVAPGASLTWLELRGADTPLALAVLDGEQVKLVHADRERVAAGGVELSLSEPLVLREGSLGAVALAAVKALQTVAPAGFLNSVETKWRSRGVLERHGQRHEGWAIHEEVLWTR